MIVGYYDGEDRTKMSVAGENFSYTGLTSGARFTCEKACICNLYFAYTKTPAIILINNVQQTFTNGRLLYSFSPNDELTFRLSNNGANGVLLIKEVF